MEEFGNDVRNLFEDGECNWSTTTTITEDAASLEEYDPCMETLNEIYMTIDEEYKNEQINSYAEVLSRRTEAEDTI